MARTGSHIKAVEPFPEISGRYQIAVSGILLAAARLDRYIRCVLVDDWTRTFREPEVHVHPFIAVSRGLYASFVPPGGEPHPPLWTCVASLVSSRVHPNADASQIIVGWFAETIDDLDAEIARAASKLDWETQAQDWEF